MRVADRRVSRGVDQSGVIEGPETGVEATKKWFPTQSSFEAFVDGVMAKYRKLGEQTEGALFSDCIPEVASNSTTRSSDLRGLVHKAYCDLSLRLPEDHVVVEPDLNAEFISRCRGLGADVPEYVLNKALMNLRKACSHSGVERRSMKRLGRETIDKIGFAAEIAARIVQIGVEYRGGESPSIDKVLCDPILRDQFDETATLLAPGCKLYEYRLAALSFRKSGREHNFQIEVAGLPEWERRLRLREIHEERVPASPGIYRVDVSAKPCYISWTLDLRNRLRAHRSVGAGLSLLPPSLFEANSDLTVQWFEVPRDWKPRRSEAVANFLQNSSCTLYNLRTRPTLRSVQSK